MDFFKCINSITSDLLLNPSAFTEKIKPFPFIQLTLTTDFIYF